MARRNERFVIDFKQYIKCKRAFEITPKFIFKKERENHMTKNENFAHYLDYLIERPNEWILWIDYLIILVQWIAENEEKILKILKDLEEHLSKKEQESAEKRVIDQHIKAVYDLVYQRLIKNYPWPLHKEQEKTK